MCSIQLPGICGPNCIALLVICIVHIKKTLCLINYYSLKLSSLRNRNGADAPVPDSQCALKLRKDVQNNYLLWCGTFSHHHFWTVANLARMQKIIIISKIAAQMVQQHYLLSNKHFP